MKPEFIFLGGYKKCSNKELHENPSTESDDVPCGQAGRQDEANGCILQF
jgi:hypothetical protein